MYGCTKWLYRPFPDPPICQSYGYIQVPDVLDLCSGEAQSIYASIPGECYRCTFQWYERYIVEIRPGIWQEVTHLITGETSNEFSVPENENSRAYFCKISLPLSTVYTDTVVLRWNPTQAEVISDISDELVCANDRVRLYYRTNGYSTTYKWWRKPIGGAWSSIPDAEYSTYQFYPTTGNNNDQYKCVAYNACWSAGKESNTITLTVNPLPEVDLGSDLHICEGDNIELGVDLSEDATYLWSTGETTRTITVGQAGSYSIDATNAENCMNYDTVEIAVDPPLTPVRLPGDQQICLNGSLLLDAGPGYDSYLWNTLETSRSITVHTAGDYWVEVSRNNNVCRAGDTVHLSVVSPFPGARICIVTVDSVTGKNMVVWEKTPGAGIDSYNVWREGSTVNDSVLVANVPFDALSVVVDEGSEPELKAHRYWITVLDTCGNESGRSNIHKTMLLTTSLGPDRINLSWLEYQVENQPYLFVGYKIYRSPTNSDFAIIDSISSGSPLYPDINPPAGTNYYRVAGLLDKPCYPEGNRKKGTGPYHHSLSNMDENKLRDVGIRAFRDGKTLTVYPNPFTDHATLYFHNPEHSGYTLYIRDLSGKIILVKHNLTGEEIRVNRGPLKPGCYLIEIAGKRICRGKMVVQ
jgi:hypothetical protein